MSTTSLKLPDALKARTANAARELGMSAHAFMIAAIEQAATRTEQRARFVANARAARADLVHSGQGFDADMIHAHLRAKVAGKRATAPALRPWRI